MRFKKFKFKSVNSTNDVAIKLIKKGNDKGIIISDYQKKGKGRYGNKWISLKGNLFTSIFYEIKKKEKIEKLNKKNCEILKFILSKYVKKKIKIKFPNDLQINKKKICGILQEIIIHKNKRFLVLGIGINICKNPSINNYPTANLSQYSDKKISKLIIFNNIKKIYEQRY
tara:strand:+ start:142 stop:651 length:510 start_codon:yes stop_codon:yes gene_type:complete